MKLALVGNPNCGKTSLFNALTGGRQKVGNYPGVTVERKEGVLRGPAAHVVLDLPGTYSLDARTPDETITRDVVLGLYEREPAPELVLAVADATSLERSLGLVLELRALGRPWLLALNMADLAHERGQELDLAALARELGVEVIATSAVKQEGLAELVAAAERTLARTAPGERRDPKAAPFVWASPTPEQVRARFREVDRLVQLVTRRRLRPTLWTERIDRAVLHPVWGSLILLVVLATLFQAIFTWAQVPMEWIKAGIQGLAAWTTAQLGAGPLQSLLADGAITGVGSVLVFLPQILLLFAFILLLEDSGYLARAAFLMDRLMGRVGLHGRAFIPLLSSYACAIPGIMATRTIENRRDRLTTILVAPLVTCSARLPVYSLLIAAFIPNRAVWGPFTLQGLVMLGLYLAGIVAALGVALVLRLTVFKGPKPPLLMELPTYKWPSAFGLLVGVLERARLFLRRAGTVILTLSVLLWFLSSYPRPPAGAPLSAEAPAISYSAAGRIGTWLEPVVRPIGFNWRIAVALIPGFAAREVMVSALGTVYAVENDEAGVLSDRIARDWSLATALSLLVWYVLACQCLSTLAVTRRETNSWTWPAVMLGYMTALAYAGSFVTYRLALLWGGG